METTIKLLEYPTKTNNFLREQGWGCGYVVISNPTHPIITKLSLKSDFGYHTIKDFSEQITYMEWEENDLGEDVYVVGFHTREMYHDSSYDKEWVEKKANQLKDYVDNYTFEDARKEINEYFDKQKQEVLDELAHDEKLTEQKKNLQNNLDN